MSNHKLLSRYIRAILTEADVQPAQPQGTTKKPPPVPSAALLTGKWETGDLAKDAQKILQANKVRLLKKGIKVDSLKQLGVGTQGVAYDMGNRVLKITKDAKEAKTSSLVMGKEFPNIIKVYDIWRFPGIDWFGLVLEKLNPLPETEAKALNDAIIQTKFTVFLYQAKYDWDVAMKLLAQDTMKTALQQAYKQFPDAPQGQGVKDPRVQEFIKPIVTKKIQDFDKLTKQYKMRELYKSLKMLDITYYDYHSGNYGLRSDGTLVLFDLGLSKSPGQLPPVLQELYNRKIGVLL